MLFPTVVFAIFFVAVLSGSCLVHSRPLLRKLGLIIASAVFYAWWDERFLLLLGAVILGNDLIVRAMKRWPGWQRTVLVAGIAANLGVLGFFKYYGFFRTSLVDALEPLGLDPSPPLLQIVLPIGVSFYVFEAIAYLLEVRRGIVERMPLVDLAAYLTFFPKLFSGPITRPSEFAPQLVGGATQIEASRALWLIGRGLVKKMVVATYLAESITDDVFAVPSQHSAGEVLLAIYAYTAQIYIDFSAYVDMAIGISLLLGITLPENFNSPYTATSVQNFWTRWHMTLSRWFRDFVFQPMVLGGSRGRVATARNIMVVMLLTGLWHGAAWTFVVWGGAHGVVMVAGRLRREYRRSHHLPLHPETTWRHLRAQLLTFHFIAFSWVIFRADSLATAWEIFGRLGDFGETSAVHPLLIAVTAGALAAQFVPVKRLTPVKQWFERGRPVVQVATLGVILLVADALGPEGVPPFIYFGF